MQLKATGRMIFPRRNNSPAGIWKAVSLSILREMIMKEIGEMFWKYDRIVLLEEIYFKQLTIRELSS
jgi:hypothetical protein